MSRGRHKLHVQVNDKEINGSPFTVTVYPDPKQLGHPVRTVTGLNWPYGIAFNNREERSSVNGVLIDCPSLTPEDRRFEHLDHAVTVHIR